MEISSAMTCLLYVAAVECTGIATGIQEDVFGQGACEKKLRFCLLFMLHVIRFMKKMPVTARALRSRVRRWMLRWKQLKWQKEKERQRQAELLSRAPGFATS